MSLSADVISKIVQCLIGLNVYKVILFGSYANGTATEDSDLDILVVLDSKERSNNFDEFIERGKPVSMALREIHRKIAMDLIVYTLAEYEYLRRQKDFFIEEIVETGKILYER